MGKLRNSLLGGLAMGPIGAGVGSLLGKDKGKQSPGFPSADLLSQMAQQIFNETAPIRSGLIDRSNQFLSGDLDVTASPLFGSLKQVVESQFGRAKDDILATLPGGGSLMDALGKLQSQKAATLTQGIGDIAGGELNRALNIGFTGQSAGLQGLQSAAQIQSGREANQAQMQMAKDQAKAQALGGLGSGLGFLLGAGKLASSEVFKENIEDADIDALAKNIESLEIKRFDYKRGLRISGKHYGPIIEKCPDVFINPDGLTLNEYNIIGSLVASVQSLTKRVRELEASDG